MNTQATTHPHVLIIGAGFGGLRAARALAKEPIRVTLIDRNNYHLFQPLLYQVATSMLSADDIAYPVRATLRGSANLDFQLGEVSKIDIASQEVFVGDGRFQYDYLVLAVGGETNYYGLEPSTPNLFGLKGLDDAARIRNHILSQFELAASEKDPEKRRALLTFVVVGGGPTGVECAGAISELVRIAIKNDYPTLDESEISILLLEAADRLLLNMPARLGDITTQVLQRKHVDVRFKVMVTSYDGNEIQLRDGGAIPAKTLIWAAGVRANRILNTFGLAQDRLGRLIVNSTLQVPEHPEIFAIGDSACLEDKDGQPLPMLAPVAMQQGITVAENIARAVQNKPLKAFTYHDPGVLATIGRSQAVAQLGRWQFHGLVAWLLWVVVHIYQLVGFRNRLVVLINWAWDYLFYDHAIRLIQKS